MQAGPFPCLHMQHARFLSGGLMAVGGHGPPPKTHKLAQLCLPAWQHGRRSAPFVCVSVVSDICACGLLPPVPLKNRSFVWCVIDCCLNSFPVAPMGCSSQTALPALVPPGTPSAACPTTPDHSLLVSPASLRLLSFHLGAAFIANETQHPHLPPRTSTCRPPPLASHQKPAARCSAFVRRRVLQLQLRLYTPLFSEYTTVFFFSASSSSVHLPCAPGPWPSLFFS